MKGMYIQRHNEAVWTLLRSLLQGRLGGSVVMHDAGHKHDDSVLPDLWATAWADDAGSGPSSETTESPAGDGGVSQRLAAQLGTRIPLSGYIPPHLVLSRRNPGGTNIGRISS
jgi:hypothetical protein